MASGGSKTGVIVVGSVVLLAGAGIAAWLLWWNPKQARAQAQGQVVAWEERWTAARSCLLGKEPLAADAADALAIAELGTGQVQRASSGCLEQVKILTRPEGARAEVAAVEDAWMEVEAAIPAVATAYALRYSARDDEIDERVAQLGVAITALDAAQDRLRAAAGMSALTRTGKYTLAKLPAPVPVTVGGAPVSQSTAGDATAGALVAFDDDDQRPTLRVVTGPTAGFELAWLGGATLAQPDRAWMAWTAEPAPGQIRNVEAAATAPTTPDERSKLVALDDDQDIEIVAALGSGAERALLGVRYEAAGDAEDDEDDELPGAADDPFADEVDVPGKLVWWTSSDGGATWTERKPMPDGYDDASFGPPLVTGYAAFVDWTAGTVDVVIGMRTGDALIQLSGATPGALPAPVAIPDGDLETACRRAGVTWWIAAGVVYRATGGAITERPLALPDGETQLTDCTADAVLIEQATVPVIYHRCTAAGCAQAFRGGSYAFGRAAMLDDGGVVYLAGRGHVLALWRDGATEPTYLALPRPLPLHDVVVWGGTAHALLYDPDDPERALLAVPLPPS